MADPSDGRGDFRALFDGLDWARTSLGPREGWSDTLRSAVDLALQTRFPITLLWGPTFTMAYNEAYTSLIGDKHPAALGADAEDVFPEIWDVVGPMLEGVHATGRATWVEETLLMLDRHGFAEETYFTFSYSTVTNVDGEVEGIIDISAENTEQVIDRRRLELLARLGSTLSGLTTSSEVCAAAAVLLADDNKDVLGVEIRYDEHPPFRGGTALPDPPASLGDGPVLAHGEPAVAWTSLSDAEPARPGESTGAALLGIMLSPHLAVGETYLDFVRLVGVTVAQALDRIAAAEADARLATVQRELSLSMQRSLLSEPVSAPDLEVAVRYRPAVQQAQIGGDWYDSFLLPDGTLTLAVGDVAGHDRAAAAAMAQVRNLLRGVAFTRYGPPSTLLRVLNDAMRGLGVGSFATAVVAQVDGRRADGQPDGSGDGARTLRWSNAGHPPPVLIEPDGAGAGVRLLEEHADLLLGVRRDSPRADHTVTLRPGSTVVFYTDGLVERRGEPLQQGLDRLIDTLSDPLRPAAVMTAQQLCDALLDGLGDTAHDDDVVLLVLRVDPGGRAAP